MSRIHVVNDASDGLNGERRSFHPPGRHARSEELPRMLTMREAQDALHMSRGSIYRLMDTHQLRFARPSERKILLFRDDVLKLLTPCDP